MQLTSILFTFEYVFKYHTKNTKDINQLTICESPKYFLTKNLNKLVIYIGV